MDLTEHRPQSPQSCPSPSQSCLSDEADVLPGAGKTGALIIPSRDTGHAKYEWDKNDPKDVADARAIFNEKKKQGYSFYRVDPKTGDKGEVIREFDPNAGQIFAVAPFAGG